MDILEQVKTTICKVAPGVDEGKLVPGALLGNDLDIDSLGMVELALAQEDAFGFYLPDDELENINTVGDIVSLVESKLEKRNV